MKHYLFFALFCFPTCMLAGPVATECTIEFETTEVTQADVAVSPDGQWLIFTMLGHLFRLPVEGGTAEQLTFGPHYDADPVFSPEGGPVLFVSDRDGSEGNLFLLNLGTREIRQVTHENWVGRPAWSPDGQTIAYLRYVRESDGPTMLTHATASVCEIDVNGAEKEVVSPEAAAISSVFYLPDGRLAWTVFEGRSPDAIWGPAPVPDAVTRIMVLGADGVVSVVREVQGIAHRFAASPAGDGFYCRRLPTARVGGWFPEEEELLFVSTAGRAVKHVAPVSGTSGWDWGPRFSVASDGGTLYFGEGGQLREVQVADQAQRTITFRAQVQLDVYAPTPPAQVVFTEPGFSAPPRTIHPPCVSPDGKHIAFGAAGFIWLQPLAGGPAQVVSGEHAFSTFPAFSPDGRLLAFVESVAGTDRIRLLDVDTGTSRTISPGGAQWQISWSPDGKRLICVDVDAQQLVTVDIRDGTREEVAPAPSPWWGSRPHFSSDGDAIFFSGTGTLYRLALEKGAVPEPLTELTGPLRNAMVSPDGQWLVFGRRREIWTAPLSSPPVQESSVRRLSSRGGDSFSLMPGTSSVLYSVGNRAWRHALTDGEREEIKLTVELERPITPAMLLRRVRLLDFGAGGFGSETAMLVERGRIRWIGSEDGRRLPEDVVTVDGEGRFVVPGLFDLHVHSSFSAYPPFIAYGITSLRDLGRGLIWVSASADRSDVTREPIPRHFYSGYNLWGPPDFVSDKDVREGVRELSVSSVGFVKAYATLPWPMQRAAADEARLLGLPVAAHGMSLQETVKGVGLGYTTLEHSGLRNYEDVIRMFAVAGTGWDPTVGATIGYPQLLQEEPRWSGYEKLRSFFPDVDARIEEFQTHSWKMKMVPVILAQQLASVGTAYSHGVQLYAGSDAPDPDHLAFPGQSLHWELELLAQAGIPPLEVLRIATQHAAEAVGAGNDLGTIEVGKLADMVLLDANPLKDIKNTQTIWRVIKGGWVFDPDELRPAASTSSARD